MSDPAFSPETFDRPSVKAENRQLRRQQKAKRQETRTGGSKPLEPKTRTQAIYLSHLRAGRHVIAVGGAGTGKTYLPARIAARALIEGKVDKIVVARATVAKPKHQLGYLPGNLDAKLGPWLKPVIEGLRVEMSGQTFDKLKLEGRIEFASFEHMRGRTFDHCFILLDEAQNADFGDLKLFLTRIGEGSQVVVTGDLDQIDIHDSGLGEVCDLILDYDVPVEIVRFGPEDVVRSELAKHFVRAFGLHAQAAVADSGHADARDVTFLDPPPRFLNNGVRVKSAA